MNNIEAYIHKNINYILELAMDICKIPSMTGSEETKAEYIMNKLVEIGCEGAVIDEIGNVLYTDNTVEDGKLRVYAAHLDTVFHDTLDIKPVIKGNRIYAPSIWDNSINIAALLFSIKLIKDLKITLDQNTLYAFDVGEEGFGNLKGIRHIVESRKNNIDELIAVDLGYDSVINTAAGSKRYSISVKTQGGHSWNDFGNMSAISAAAGIIKSLYELKVPESPKTVYNVGIVKGGTSVNTIAQSCQFDIDLRSEDGKCLKDVDRNFVSLLDKFKNEKVDIKCSLTGERPCGILSPESGLQKKITEIRKELNLKEKFRSGSTDANIPLSMGIPAISFGVCNGGGAHTLEEYIETDTLETGIKHLLYFMLKG